MSCDCEYPVTLSCLWDAESGVVMATVYTILYKSELSDDDDLRLCAVHCHERALE